MNDKTVAVFGIGNPSRGDDALAPCLLTHLEKLIIQQSWEGEFELFDNFQLQIEHTLDIAERKLVLFIDASITAKAPFEFLKVEPSDDESFTTHALSPEALMSVYQQVNEKKAPAAYVLAIAGYTFNLGEPLSNQAADNLNQALEFCQQLFSAPYSYEWDKLCK